MKKYLIFFTFLCLFSSLLTAQNVPLGMKYQAVARDAKGEILVEKEISLQIKLLSTAENKDFYSEIHTVTTNKMGLFSLTIGQGVIESGSFKDVPWSTSEIWMSIGLDEYNEGDFLTISNSKLLAVPYAMHSLSADRLTNVVSKETSGAVGADKTFAWMLTGNLNTYPGPFFIGTRDNKKLIFKTNNIERLKITADGDIDIANSVTIGMDLDVGNNLVVDNNVTLNDKAGETIVRGNLSVTDRSSTYLTGTLVVEGATDLNSTLDVNNGNATNLTGTLNVDGATDLNNTLDVDASTHLNIQGGTTVVEGPTTIHNTLDVDGDTDLNRNLNVDGTTDLNGSLDVNNASPTNLSGTLDVAGATSFTGNMNIGGATNLGSTLTVAGGTDLNSTLDVNNGSATNLSGTLDVDGLTHLKNTTQSTSTTTGALRVAGGVGIEKNLNVGGTAKFNSTLSVVAAAGAGAAAHFQNTNNGDGITIQVGAGTPNNSNDFITFRNSAGGTVGRIEGQTAAELHASPEYQWQEGLVIAEEVKAAADVAIAFIPMPGAGVVVTATVCVPCVIMAAADLALATANLASFYVNVDANYGVTYQSGSADYAEWLERQNPNEKIVAGEIVGVYGGKISKYTKDARQFMVISTKPAMLGNMPEEGQEGNYEKVAFMGQIPVRVRGFVIAGDYILPSGLNDGTGIAVSPEEIKANQLANIVGVAWSASYSEGVISTINMAIGLNSNDVANIVAQQEQRLTNLEARLIALETGTEYVPNIPVKVQKTRAEFMAESMPAELSDEIMQEAIVYLKERYVANGIDYTKRPVLNKLFTDNAFQSEIIKKTQETYKANYKLILAKTEAGN